MAASTSTEGLLRNLTFILQVQKILDLEWIREVVSKWNTCSEVKEYSFC